MSRGRLLPLVAALLLAAVGALIYANSLQGAFVFDDVVSIRDNPNVRSLTPLSRALTGVSGSGSSGRPVVALSLALNYALGGLEVRGYHLFNVGVHLAAALALFGLARRALLRTGLRARALPLGFAIALVWLVHPLNTDALNHVVYRNEALAALFIVLALYGAERCFEGGRGWAALSVTACALAMGSKEYAVVAPFLVLAYDRSFVSGSFAAALRARRGYYLALAATWLVLAASMASGDRGQAVGFDVAEMSSLDYLRTQAGAISHYLRLSAWPSPLVFDYFGWPPVRSWGPALLPGAFVLVLFGASLVAFRRRTAAGFLGLAFFAVLAPSSSFIPITGEWIAEHRMYLPLMALSALVVPAVYRLLERCLGARAGLVGGLLLLAVAAPLARATVRRNADYASAVVLWSDVLRVYPRNARALDQLALALMEQGRFGEALAHAEEAQRLDPELLAVDYNLATIQLQLGRYRAAVANYALALEKMPEVARAHANHGAALANVGRLDEAAGELREALRLDPDYRKARGDLILVLLEAGRPRQAARAARAALERDPGDASLRRQLATALMRSGDPRAAVVQLREALRLRPDAQAAAQLLQLLASHPDAGVRDGAAAVSLAESLTSGSGAGNPYLLDLAAAAYAEAGRFEEACDTARRAMTLAREQDQDVLAGDIGRRLQLYLARQPYHASPPESPPAQPDTPGSPR